MSEALAVRRAAEAELKTCVFPIAGRKAAFQPATKSIPRELLPIIDRPTILHAVEEAKAAGCERFVFVQRPDAFEIRRYFERDPALERDLEEIFGAEVSAKVREVALPDGSMHFVEQRGGRGLGYAIGCAREIVGDEPFAVILPDDIVFAERPVLAQMAARRDDHEGAMIAGIEVTRKSVAKYGIMRIEDTGGDLVAVVGLDEKPDTDSETSNFAIAGRYILPPEVFAALEKTAPDAGGAVQLTDAIARMIGATPVRGFRFQGERFDCGEPSGFVRATIAEAMRRPDLRDDTLLYMRRMLDRHAAQTGRS